MPLMLGACRGRAREWCGLLAASYDAALYVASKPARQAAPHTRPSQARTAPLPQPPMAGHAVCGCWRQARRSSGASGAGGARPGRSGRCEARCS